MTGLTVCIKAEIARAAAKAYRNQKGDIGFHKIDRMRSGSRLPLVSPSRSPRNCAPNCRAVHKKYGQIIVPALLRQNNDVPFRIDASKKYPEMKKKTGMCTV